MMGQIHSLGFDGCGYVDLFALEVPEGGGKIKTIFTALDKGAKLADGDSGMCTTNGVSQEVPGRIYNDTELGGERGFRHVYVALLKNGERVYHSVDKVYGRGEGVVSDKTSFVVPADTERLWFVVTSAPTKFVAPKWDDNELNDDQWPYQVQFIGTKILK